MFDYVRKSKLIDDKSELLKLLEQYYCNDFNEILRQFEKGDFDEAIISGSTFDNFKPSIPDNLNKGSSEVIGSNDWRP